MWHLQGQGSWNWPKSYDIRGCCLLRLLLLLSVSSLSDTEIHGSCWRATSQECLISPWFLSRRSRKTLNHWGIAMIASPEKSTDWEYKYEVLLSCLGRGNTENTIRSSWPFEEEKESEQDIYLKKDSSLQRELDSFTREEWTQFLIPAAGGC